MNFEFTQNAWEEFSYWLETDTEIVLKIKELLKLSLAHIQRMAHFVEADVIANPVDVGLFCPVAVMLSSYRQTDLIK